MRIEALLRLNPRISAMMGCSIPAAPGPAACDIRGANR
jgi:hypothetical protein